MFNLVVLIDLRKAFDTVDHQILLRKLEVYGAKGQALSFLNSYLSNRSQKCHINGFLSSEKMNRCGVPQGSILGPLFKKVKAKMMFKLLNDMGSLINLFTYKGDYNLRNISSTLCLPLPRTNNLKKSFIWYTM